MELSQDQKQRYALSRIEVAEQEIEAAIAVLEPMEGKNARMASRLQKIVEALQRIKDDEPMDVFRC